ncbi:hypothetical protein F4809DRAFT_594930 [Biscogniauxia mediterranea]|nr:hypothetical protein F4809DRAFT_594930 [Biscogniauxia mediterranea]
MSLRYRSFKMLVVILCIIITPNLSTESVQLVLTYLIYAIILLVVVATGVEHIHSPIVSAARLAGVDPSSVVPGLIEYINACLHHGGLDQVCSWSCCQKWCILGT